MIYRIVFIFLLPQLVFGSIWKNRDASAYLRDIERRVFKEKCHRDDADGCLKLGDYHSMVSLKFELAMMFYRKGCVLKSGRSCKEVAFLIIKLRCSEITNECVNKSLSNRKIESAVESLLTKACMLKDISSCSFLNK